MNHSQLRAFHAVASFGSFTKASATLGISQPTISGHVRALEEGYGVILFIRGGRRVELTEIGRSLFDATQRYFALEGELQDLLATAKGLLHGQIRVGADSPYYVLPLIAKFSRIFPGVRKAVSFGNSKTILRDLYAHKIDVAIIPEIRPDPGLKILPFHRGHLVVLVDLSHSWAQRRSVKLQEIAGERVILREPGSTTRAILEATLQERGIRLEDILELGSREAAREGVAAGLGIGVIAEAELGQDARLHKLQVQDARLESIECVVYREESHTPSLAAFLKLAAEFAGARADRDQGESPDRVHLPYFSKL